MYLKSITLKGFKSFPDRTRLEFGPGVSVIVGPNGSGKSNVTDAVLWALGEQSPLAVRGQSMQDVIFGGAPGRQAARSAEVELVLDDSEATSSGSASPRSRSCAGSTATARASTGSPGARCRLVDVIELLSDTGLGKEMHSVISQGRVESIVTSKPRDRRMLIEEAAGLGKHRKRRRRAQLKLEHTQDNLDRALDVEREARSRLRPLKRQAEAAELHARLQRQTLEVGWELARDDLRRHQTELAAAREAAAQARARREQVERELEASPAAARPPRRRWRSGSAQREELSRRRFAAQSAGERVSYRAEAVRAAARDLEGRLRGDRERLARLSEAALADAPDAQADARIAELEQELAALDRDREAELARQLAELEGQLEAARRSRRRPVSGRSSERSAAREQARERLEQARAEHAGRRAGGRGRARREAARVGGELAAVQPVPAQPRPRLRAAPPSLADALDVAPGYELAVAAALDGRLGAAVAGGPRRRGGAARPCGRRRRPRAHVESGGAPDAVPARAGAAPHDGAERLGDHVRGRRRRRRAGAAPAARRVGRRDLEHLSDRVRRRRGHALGPRVVGPHARAAAGAGRRRGARAGRAQPPRALIAASEAAVQAEHGARAGARAPRRGGGAGRERVASRRSRRTAPRSPSATRRARSNGGSRPRSSAGGPPRTRAPTPAAARSCRPS